MGFPAIGFRLERLRTQFGREDGDDQIESESHGVFALDLGSISRRFSSHLV